MSNEQLYIPDKIKVGFQKREGTYTGKLAYVIYYDGKGVLRKESSWKGWRHDNIPPLDFDNVPTEGFVLNKKVGGVQESWGWNTRKEYVRVYDPRDFEFEISIPNLLFILRECDCSRGKGLEGQFVYSWSGKELVLLPVQSEEYRKSKNFTKLQVQGVKSRELIPGATYITKKQKPLTYLGKFDYHYLEHTYRYNGVDSDANSAQVVKRYVFWDDSLTTYDKKKVGFTYLQGLSNIAALESDQVISNFAELVQKYHKSVHGTKVVKLFLKEMEPPKRKEPHYRYTIPWAFERSEGEFITCDTNFGQRQDNSERVESVTMDGRYWFKDGILQKQTIHWLALPPDAPKNGYHPHYGYGHRSRQEKWVEPTNMRLFAELESGSKFEVQYNTFGKD